MEKRKNKMKIDEVYNFACQIYNIWQKQGIDKLKYFFQQELKVPNGQVDELALRYKPIKPPQKSVGNQMFQDLSLQLSNCSTKGILPKDILAWWVIKKFNEEIFDFQVIDKHVRERSQINFLRYPCNKWGQMVPLRDMISENIEIEELPVHMFKKSKKIVEYLGKSMGQDLTRALFKAQIIFPSSNEVELLCETILKGLNGERIIIAGEFYPDYSYKKTNNSNIPFCYTFEKVNRGVGLVAQQIAYMLPFLSNFFRKYHIQYDIKLAIGDFEADNPKILRRLKISRQDFVENCECSLARFREFFSESSLELFLFQEEWAKQRWKKYKESIYTQMSKGNFEDLKNKTGKHPQGIVDFIQQTNYNFYCNLLCIKKIDSKKIKKNVLHQGAEHAAISKIFAEDIKQPIIQLAGDHPQLQLFNKMYAEHITLCAQRIF